MALERLRYGPDHSLRIEALGLPAASPGLAVGVGLAANALVIKPPSSAGWALDLRFLCVVVALAAILHLSQASQEPSKRPWKASIKPLLLAARSRVCRRALRHRSRSRETNTVHWSTLIVDGNLLIRPTLSGTSTTSTPRKEKRSPKAGEILYRRRSVRASVRLQADHARSHVSGLVGPGRILAGLQAA